MQSGWAGQLLKNRARLSGLLQPLCGDAGRYHSRKTFCCGAGGGLLTDELMPIRMAGGKPRAMAVKHVQANYLATPCAICKAQLPEVMKYWDVPVQVGGVIDLLANALKL